MNTKKSDTEFFVDFIARGEAPDEWLMVLVENGPWANPVEVELTRLQNRLYDCIDAALDGQLAAKFPESRGETVVIRVDGYDLPAEPVESFFTHFSTGALSGDYAMSLEASPFTKSIRFQLILDQRQSFRA